jgi:hypothetical protein
MNDRDLLIRQFYARILPSYGGILPLGNFAEVNGREGGTIQLKFLNAAVGTSAPAEKTPPQRTYYLPPDQTGAIPRCVRLPVVFP